MKRVGVVTDPMFLQHYAPNRHPECPERLSAIDKALEIEGLKEKVIELSARDATIAHLEQVHSKNHIDQLQNLSADESSWIDSDTYMNDCSFRAAVRAAGGLLQAVDEIRAGSIDHAFCFVRPPGHHATSTNPMGFCLINNVAVAAKYAQLLGYERVFILDWDVHHGNGTQDIFYRDPTVFFASIHQMPLYPGSGRQIETGEGKGDGFTLNIPQPARAGDQEFIAAVQKALSAAVEFKPDIIFVSAGFDAHENDPLASCTVTTDGFGRMARLVVDAAESLCEGRMIATLEGGYDLDVLGSCVGRVLSEMLDEGKGN
ncbi:MAG: histone deacetylase [Candidatus Lindowbacteria bacterium]|nr:histone deacetylase [Candidatus Lindowbacteria bacterium]